MSATPMPSSGLTLQRCVRRGAAVGALLGVLWSSIILVLYLQALRSGLTPASAGYGPGIWAWIASLPFGLLGVWLVGSVLKLAHVDGSTSTNMMWILIVGVVGNWTAIGATVGAVFAWYRKLVPA